MLVYRPMRFADLPDNCCDPETSGMLLLPVPFERTTSYGRGTVDGPRAILTASQQVELYDPELDAKPCGIGIATLPCCAPNDADLDRCLAEIEHRASAALARFPGRLVALGGEHSITAPLVRAARRRHPNLGVVQLDAHADLRDEYEGTTQSHACVMKRLVDEGIPCLGAGIRSLSAEEAELIRERELAVIYAHELTLEAFRAALEPLPDEIYLTFDVDVFDPTVMPATGTPEPGGIDWSMALALLEILFEEKTVIGGDVVELAPHPAHHHCDFTVAKLIYRWAALLQA